MTAVPNIVPGAIWRPIPIDYSRRPKRRKGRGLIGHIAVSNSPDLRGNPTGNNWHFYLPYEGPAIQQIDLDYVSAASKAGDATCASFESQGGLGTIAEVNRQRWNPNQAWWAARILRHLHDTEDAPLQVMPDSRPDSRGFATHRLGIDPYRVAGGESWSSSYGKACPGDGRHAQRGEIVSLAQTMNGADDMLNAEEHQWLADIRHTLTGGKAGEKEAGQVWSAVTETRAAAMATQARVVGLEAAVRLLAEARGLDPDAVEALLAKVDSTVRAAMANVVDVRVTVGDGDATAGPVS